MARRPFLVIAIAWIGLGAPLAVAAKAGATTAADLTTLAQTDTNHFDAMVHGDERALSRSLADELVYVHSSSVRQSKSELLRDVHNGVAVYRRIEAKEQVPRLYGDVGIIQGVATFTTGKDGATTFTLRYTDAYVFRDGRWQMVAWHCTRMPASP